MAKHILRVKTLRTDYSFQFDTAVSDFLEDFDESDIIDISFNSISHDGAVEHICNIVYLDKEGVD